MSGGARAGSTAGESDPPPARSFVSSDQTPQMDFGGYCDQPDFSSVDHSEAWRNPLSSYAKENNVMNENSNVI